MIASHVGPDPGWRQTSHAAPLKAGPTRKPAPPPPPRLAKSIAGDFLGRAMRSFHLLALVFHTNLAIGTEGESLCLLQLKRVLGTASAQLWANVGDSLLLQHKDKPVHELMRCSVSGHQVSPDKRLRMILSKAISGHQVSPDKRLRCTASTPCSSPSRGSRTARPCDS